MQGDDQSRIIKYVSKDEHFDHLVLKSFNACLCKVETIEVVGNKCRFISMPYALYSKYAACEQR